MPQLVYEEYKPVPPGMYRLRLQACKEAENTKDHSKYLNWQAQIVSDDPELSNKSIYFNTSLSLGQKSRTYGLVTACGIDPSELTEGVTLDTESLMGQEFVGKVGQKPNTKGNINNTLEEFFSLEEFQKAATAVSSKSVTPKIATPQKSIPAQNVSPQPQTTGFKKPVVTKPQVVSQPAVSEGEEGPNLNFPK